jgi:hypothetical protein
MAKQTFVANAILTAAQQNALQSNDFNQTVSAKTASYTLVAADVGTRITMNNASATTITVNTSLFAAGDTLFIQNIGAGVCTITANTATVSSSSGLDLAQYQGGELYFTSASAAIFLPSNGSGWQSYTPTFTSFTLGNGTLIAKFIQIGKFVCVKFEVTLGSTSSMGTAPQASLPVTASSSITSQVSSLGFSVFGDTGTAAYYGAVTYSSTTTVYLWYFDVASSKVLRGTINSTAPFTWGNTDTFAAQFVYEAA